MTSEKFYKILNQQLPVTNKINVERIALLLGLAIKAGNTKLNVGALEILILESTENENLRSAIKDIFRNLLDKSFSETLIRASDIADDKSVETIKRRKKKKKHKRSKERKEANSKTINKQKRKPTTKKSIEGIVFIGKIPNTKKPSEISIIYKPTSIASETEEDPLHRK